MSPPDSSTHPAMKTWFHGDMVLLSLRQVDLGSHSAAKDPRPDELPRYFPSFLISQEAFLVLAA